MTVHIISATESMSSTPLICSLTPELTDENRTVKGTIMDNNKEFWRNIKFIYGDGDPCNFGCSDEKFQEMISLSQELFPDKPYRVVKEWHWGDLELDDQHLDRLDKMGLKPAFIFAKEIIVDGTERDGEGRSVKTSPLFEFHHGCLFVTRNTTYILVGAGTRMTVHPFVFSYLFSL